ncbi:HD-GYP domain-containing protein [Virgibacillus sp. C22-A2]|uniref:HD-GYP domain-containing protein n=1 Tax=Virgibacillus tibetensis TaxID=3042313 RepID=A0ABU6KJM1_9BACI|nr:HD-GYP domain-containing protein [Virgibacillus sp. C22-A2]
MRVEPSQLVPGCVLLNEVKGKSNKALIPQKTILNEEHILFLQKFLIHSVDVSSKLVDGEEFIPKEVHEEETEQELSQENNESNLLFKDHYHQAVSTYKVLFNKWENGFPIDMPYIRRVIIPLFERMDDISNAVYTLHHYANKKDYFYYHGVAVGLLSAYLGKKMGFSKGEWLQIGLAGFLSDSGMAKIPPAIVTKSSSLTYQEIDEVKNHPTYSYRLVESIPTITQTVKLAVLQHHERMDGSGYPLGLTKEKIHIYARIIAVCDMYHAMTTERIYKEKQSPFKVIEEIQKEQFSKLDPQVVKAFIDSLANFSIGTKVRLSNGQLAEIVFIDARKPTRPMVRMGDKGEIISLQDNLNLFIDEIMGSQ